MEYCTIQEAWGVPSISVSSSSKKKKKEKDNSSFTNITKEYNRDILKLPQHNGEDIREDIVQPVEIDEEPMAPFDEKETSTSSVASSTSTKTASSPPFHDSLTAMESKINDILRRIDRLQQHQPITFMEVFIYFTSGIFFLFILDLFVHLGMRFHKS